MIARFKHVDIFMKHKRSILNGVVHRIIKENLPWLAILQKIDPSKIHYGVNWYNVQRTKNKKLPAGTGESIYPTPYIKVINAIERET